ncbi:MAG: tetratricopeptide repeat protein, partial [Candidatus Roizmanbacteria bacterium]|nr:tetratricopeptide repeat protein [Candidatus Roizmanbacteria bacterium]
MIQKKKEKTNPSKKGSKLEDLTVDLLRRLSKEFGFRNEKLRRQNSSLQFGKDIIWKFRFKSGEKTERYHWVIEDKNYDTTLTPQLLGHKLDQAHRSSINTPIDNFVLFSPKQAVNNDYSETVDAKKSPYTFGVVFWTPDEEIEQLIQCFPDLYEKIYGSSSSISEKDRTETLAYWKERILEEAAKGASIRLEKVSAKQLSGDKTAVVIDQPAAKQLLQETTEAALQTSQTRNITKTTTNDIADPTEKGLIGVEIDEALALLDGGKIQPALTSLFTILGKVQGNNNLQHELARTCNNIGVAYNRLGQNEDAVQYFRKALEAEKGFVVPATNLASTFIVQAELSDGVKEKVQLLDKAAKIIDPLMTDFHQGFEGTVLHSYLRLLKV